MAKAKIKRVHDYEAGTSTFTMIATNKVVVCDVAALINKLFAEIKIDLEWSDLPILVRKLLLHAINAKVGDSASDPKKGHEEMEASWDGLWAGKWAQGGGRGDTLSTFEKAIRDTVVEWIQTRKSVTQIIAKKRFGDAESAEEAFRAAVHKDVPKDKVTAKWQETVAKVQAYADTVDAAADAMAALGGDIDL